ncbi:MAG: hypothetical protein ACM339_09500 [Ignavibacteria bacterium]
MSKAFTNVISIFIFLFINTCCSNKQHQFLTKILRDDVIFIKKPNINEIPIELGLIDSIATKEEPNIKLSIELTNKSNDKIAILPAAKIGMIWHAYVLLNDSIPYYHQSFDMAESEPSKVDYLVIEPLSKISLSFDLNISEYAKKELMFHGKNIDYGIYKIEIVYRDIFLKHFNAISGIHSNKVSLFYKNN